MEMWREVAPLFAVTAMAHHRLNVCRPDLRWADPPRRCGTCLCRFNWNRV